MAPGWQVFSRPCSAGQSPCREVPGCLIALPWLRALNGERVIVARHGRPIIELKVIDDDAGLVQPDSLGDLAPE
jgi:hypothetical protein